MSRSRARSSNSVSLFPFLAVLVCAMGALIFLLIVTTQRIRSEAVARAVAQRQEKKNREQEHRPRVLKPALSVWVSPAVTKPEPYLAKPDVPTEPERMEPIPGLVELGIALSAPVLPPPQVIPPLPPEPEPEPIWPAAIAQKPAPIDPNIKLRAQYAELQAARKAWLDAVRKKEQAVAQLKQQVDSLTENLRKINAQLEDVAKDRAAARETQRELLESRNGILGQLAKVEQQIEDTKKGVAGSPTKFQVVPFDGLTGTNYRPIIIECTADGMRFQPEDVLLTQDDFDGFTLGKNPLLAGAKALSNYWTKISVRSGGKEPGPYVLLIVRPSGAKYYAARQLLEALDRPFGYELVEENLPLDVPPRDPVAAELCRNAVAEILKEREEVKKLLVSHGPEILSRNPNYRVIRKPGGGFEVEHAPDGQFAEDGLGANQEQPLFGPPTGDGFGPPRPTETPAPDGNFSENGGGRQPRAIGVPPAPSVSQRPPYFGNENQGTRNPSSPQTQNPARTDQGVGDVDSHQPRLLPDEILRRSQGHLPYEGNEENLADSKPSANVGSQDAIVGNGNSREPFTKDPGSPGNLNPELATGNRGETDPSTIQGNGRNSSPNSNSENLSNSSPSPTGQSANPTITNNSPQTPKELASPNSQSNAGQSPPQGTPGTGAGSPSPPGAPSSAYEPAMPNFLTLNSRRMQNQAEPYQRRWGLSDPRASIGFEREITVRVEPARLVVGNAFAVAYDARTTKDQLGAGLLEAIELTVRKWGRPPMSFYWVPTIRFQVSDAEVPVYRLLAATAKAWGLETSAEGLENSSLKN